MSRAKAGRVKGTKLVRAGSLTNGAYWIVSTVASLYTTRPGFAKLHIRRWEPEKPGEKLLVEARILGTYVVLRPSQRVRIAGPVIESEVA